MGLRLKLRKSQAAVGDIVLLFSDESEALTHPYLAYAWAKRGADLRVPAPGQSKNSAIFLAQNLITKVHSAQSGQNHTRRSLLTFCMNLGLEQKSG